MRRSRRAGWSQRLDMLLPDVVRTRLPGFVQRVFGIGPRYGIARGMALYGSGTDGEIDADSVLLKPDELLRWLAARGESSDMTRDALVAVQRRREEALADEEFGHMLGGEVALLLGQVLIASVVGAHWHVWPNGHPVLRIGRTDLDVTEIADAYLCRQGPPPSAIVDRYRGAGR
uniref:Uncharacterized protein n=1 Tax=Rhodococcus sp. NS1 TaxID=402236 RepID=A0A097SQ77_9NOCA|nr:hypothetical protein LRS1606.241 [Rhodococcus sp. NS1]